MPTSNKRELQTLVDDLVKTIGTNKRISAFCHDYACTRAEIKDWSQEEWDRNEETAQCKLYWAEYTMCQMKIVAMVSDLMHGSVI